MRKSLKKIYILIISLIIGLLPITVNATAISLNKNKITLGVGYSETLKYTLTSGLNSSNIVWKSSDEKVATVSNGKVTKIIHSSGSGVHESSFSYGFSANGSGKSWAVMFTRPYA